MHEKNVPFFGYFAPIEFQELSIEFYHVRSISLYYAWAVNIKMKSLFLHVGSTLIREGWKDIDFIVKSHPKISWPIGFWDSVRLYFKFLKIFN